MDGFKNTTKTQYTKAGSSAGYAKGGSVKGAAKISKVMGEFKSGKLHSGSKGGPKVTNPKQATAIAMSEARGAKMPIKRDRGGGATIADLNRANRDFGGMSEAAIAAAGRAIESGNRMSAEEGNESRLVTRKAGAKVPVQKKSLGGVLEAVTPLAAAVFGGPFGGLSALLIQQLLKKKQSGVITPDDQKKLDAAGAGSSSPAAPAPAAPAPAAAKKGGLMKKAKGYADGGEIVVMANKAQAPATSGMGASSYRLPAGRAAAIGNDAPVRGGSALGQRLAPLAQPGSMSATGPRFAPAVVTQPLDTLGSLVGARTPKAYGATGRFNLAAGGKVAKKGVPVAPKGPLVGLSVMPRKK